MPRPGRVITRTPKKPMAMAASRLAPTVSPSKGPDSKATHSGIVKAIDEVSASCK